MNSERQIIARLREGINDNEIPETTNPVYQEQLNISIRNVMSAYQNANKWLDSIKEQLLIDLKCPYFSNVVHQLAHTMPVRFDAFGEILHTVNIKIPYPGTHEYVEETHSIKGIIEIIYKILDSIRDSLLTFKKVAENDITTAPLSIKCDQLISDIIDEYEYFIRVESQLPYYGNNLAHWDKKAYEYYQNKNNLI